MSFARKMPGLVEAACLTGLGGFLAYLVLAGNYWMYLNPRFKGLSLAAALVLVVLGGYSFLRPPKAATWIRAGAYVLVLVLCLVSEVGLSRWFAISGLDSRSASEPEEAPLPSRVTRDGTEYVRINIGELYDIVGKSQTEKMGLPYALRGFVRRTPATDATGEFVIYRIALHCCYADTTAVGFRVRLPKGGAMPADGSWVVVYGIPAPAHDPGSEAVTSLGGSVFASVQPDYRIDARFIEAEKTPGLGMMYEWRAEEPYAY